MPRVEKTITVPVSPNVAFAVSQTQGEIRCKWDPFIREQRLLDGALKPARRVRTFTRSRHGFSMTTEYVSYNPPTHVGMKMIDGPRFFSSFGGGWSFQTYDGGASTEATCRYSFCITPDWLAPIANRIGMRMLGRDIRRRIQAYAQACVDSEVVDAALHSVPG